MSASRQPRLRAAAVLIASMPALVAGNLTARAQTPAECSDPNPTTPEPFGPTDINAVSGNGGLSVGFNKDGTITVLKWPSPSYYDQIKYLTESRDQARKGALPNEGSFLGVATSRTRGKNAKWRFSWLRTWNASQRFTDDDGDTVRTVFVEPKLGLRVTVRDVVAHNRDLLTRSIVVSRKPSSGVRLARVIAFANFNPVFSKIQRSPTNDWCTEERNDDGASYSERADAILHARSGTDESTGDSSGAALAMGFSTKSQGHHVGVDTYESSVGGTSAYDDASDGKLSGADSATGQADAAIADQLNLGRRRTRTTTLHIAAGFTAGEARTTLNNARSTSAASIRRNKSRWWRRWLSGTKVPDGPPPVVKLAKRALITARQNTDQDLIVTSIATQPPQGLDWIRNGAYINRMLDIAGKRALVTRHNQAYARLQATSVDKPVGGEATPPGNWSQNYYADGVVGGAIPYSIDSTGLGIWTLWDHYTFTKDDIYLEFDAYEPIQRAAHYLSDTVGGCRDPATGLHCPAPEGDDPEPQQTLIGAQAVWLGLDAAVKAGIQYLPLTSNKEIVRANIDKWRDRRTEIGRAIRSSFLDPDCMCYSQDHEVGGTNLWPVGFEPYGSNVSKSQANVNFRHVSRARSGRARRGVHTTKAILGNAYEWAGERALNDKLKRALVWVAGNLTTNRTGLLGEAWMHYPAADSPIVTMQGQPNLWAQSIYYLAAVKVYGKKGWRP